MTPYCFFLLLLLFWEIFTPALADGFSQEFEWSKSSQVYRTLLSILANLNNAVVWMVSTPSLPVLIPTLRDCTKNTNYNWYQRHFLVLQFFLFSGKVYVLSSLFVFFQFSLWSTETAKSTIWQVLFFLSIIIRSGRLAEIKWSVYISKSQRNLRVLFSRTDSGLCIYHLFVWSNWNFLHNSQWITFPTQSCLVSYSFYMIIIIPCVLLYYFYYFIPCNFFLHQRHLVVFYRILSRSKSL